MNAAARLFNQGELSRGWVVLIFFTRFQYSLCILIACILLSALSLIYVTNSTRCLNANLHQLALEHDRLQVEQGQLLLEKSSLTMQARIQQVAEHQLNMIMPEGKSVIVIKGDHNE